SSQKKLSRARSSATRSRLNWTSWLPRSWTTWQVRAAPRGSASRVAKGESLVLGFPAIRRRLSRLGRKALLRGAVPAVCGEREKVVTLAAREPASREGGPIEWFGQLLAERGGPSFVLPDCERRQAVFGPRADERKDRSRITRIVVPVPSW